MHDPCAQWPAGEWPGQHDADGRHQHRQVYYNAASWMDFGGRQDICMASVN